jgi:tetratricopeptide (TPR) repeat protein
MIKKYRIINSLFLVLVLSIGLFGCASFDDDVDEADVETVSENQVGKAPTKKKKGDDFNKLRRGDDAEEGMIRVRRHGPGYDVTMDIDASDENIAFLMDLPQQKQVDKLKKDVYDSYKAVMKAQTLFYKEKYVDALAAIDTAIDFAADNAMAHALKGTILFKLQKTQDAVYSWQRALELDPTLTDIRATLKKLGIKE